MKNLQQTLIVIIANCTLLLFNCDAANRFWIAGSTGDWNSTANWSTSSGGSGGASVPGSSDVAKFDGSGTGNCTINATVNVAGIDIGTGYTGTISQGSYLVTVGSSHYTQADGTWTGGSVKMIVNGKLALNGGTFTATGDTLYIGHDGNGNTFVHSSGTFNHNNGAVYFTAGANSDIIDVLSSTQFYTVIAGITYYYSIKSATNDTIKIANTFYHKSGYLGGIWQLQGNLKIGSSANVNNLESQLIFSGTANQTYESSTGRTGRIKIDKSSGSVASASGNTALNCQSFTLVSGTFTAPSGDFKIGGSLCTNGTVFLHSGGTFNANNGTVVFDPLCYSRSFTVDVLTSTIFNNVTANHNFYETLTSASGDTVKIDGNFNHKNGELDGIWQVKGNLKVEGGNSGYNNKEALVLLTGTNNQTYEYTTGRTGKLKINKSSGTVTAASGTTNLSVQNLIMEAGSFTAPSGSLKIGGRVCTNKTIFTHTGGTFTHNSGTVLFDPYCYNGFFTVDVNSTTLFNHVTSNPNIYESVKSASGDTVKMDGDFYHKTGDLGGIWEFKGNLKVESGSTGAYNQDGLVIFGGTANQTYQHAGGYATRIKVNKSSGTVSPASGTTTLNSLGFILDAGSFTAPSGEFKIGGPYNSSTYTTLFIQTGGSYTHNNGTVVFNPTNYWYDYKLDVISSTLFNNVTAQHVYSRYLKVETGDTLKMAGNLNHYSGDLGGIWDLKGNLNVSSGSATAGYAAQEGLIIFSGTANQTYSYTAGVTSYILIDKPSGSVSALAGTTDFKVQGFKLVNGTFTAPTGGFYIGNRNCSYQTVFNHSGGTFNHNNGRVIFKPSCWANPFTIDVIPVTRFYNVTDDHQNGIALNLASGDTLHVDNEMKFQSGLFNTGVIAVKGKVIATPGNGVNAQLLFCGTADQDFDLTGYTNYYNGSIKINKPSGKVNLLSACVLDQSGQTLTFVKGTIGTTGTNLLTIGHGVTVSGASNDSYVDGPMKKVGNAAFTFPVGKNGHYRKIGISAPSVTTDAYTGEYFEVNSNDTYSHSAKDGSIAELSRNEYWNLARTTGTSNVSVTLSIDSATSCSVDNLSNLKVAAWDGSTWKDKGNGGTSGNVYVGTVVTSGTSSVYGAYSVGTSTSLDCQVGVSCLDVLNIPSVDSCFSVNQTEKEYWLSFEAEADTINIRALFDTTGTCGAEKIELYSGSCGGLVLIEEIYLDSIEAGRMLEAIMNVDSLIVNDTYYLKITKETAGGCLNTEVTYTICLKSGLGGCVFIPDARDCEDAFLVCGNHTLFTFCEDSDDGDVSEINRELPHDPWDSCFPQEGLIGGVERPTFLRFIIQTSGYLEFIIAADNNDGSPAQIGQYDWILYRYDGTTCTALAAQQLLPISCEWNASILHGTGMMSDGTAPSPGEGNFQDPIPVNCGEEYLLMVNNWNPVSTPVIIDFLTNPGDATIGCDPIEQIIIQAEPADICVGESTTLTASLIPSPSETDIEYVWSLLGSPTGESITVSPTQTTVYMVYGETSCGPTSATATVIVHAPYFYTNLHYNTDGYLIDFDIIEHFLTDKYICSGDYTVLSIGSEIHAECHHGGIDFEWYANGSLIGTGTSIGVSPTIETVYTIRAVCPILGCYVEDDLTIYINTISAEGVALAPSCPEPQEGMGVAGVAPSGGELGYTYSWQTDPEQTTEEATELSPGDYTVTVTDDMGCTAEAVVTILPMDDPTIDPDVTNVSCYGGADGEITIDADDAPYPYIWSPNVSTTEHPTHLEAGEYTVTVTAENGCWETLMIEVTEPPTAVEVDVDDDDLLCFGDDNGSLTANASGGTAGYTYLWNDADEQTTETATGLVAGEYTVTVTDENGCVAYGYATVTEPSEIEISITSTPDICDGEDGQLIAGVTGGTPEYEYLWSPTTGITSGDELLPNPTVDLGLSGSNTEYTLTVTDANGCEMVYENYELTYIPCCIAATHVTYTDDDNRASDWPGGITGDGTDGNTIADFAINGLFIVDEDFTIDNAEVLLGPSAQIIVEDGNTLTITSDDSDEDTRSHLYACEYMWDGIYVMPDAKIVVNKGSVIEDAKMAVWSDHPGADGYTFDDAVFNKNYIHFYVTGNPANIQSYPGSIINSDFLCQNTESIIGTTTLSYENLKPPYANDITYAGVMAAGMYALPVGAADEGNVFDNGYFGIVTVGSNAEIIDNEFHHFMPPAGCTDFNCIINYGKCIYATTGNTNTHTLEVNGGNEFYDSNWGVQTYNNMHLIVDDNDFTRVKYGITANQSVMAHRNIRIEDNDMVDVRLGIWCNDNKTADIHINRNDIAVDAPDAGAGIVVTETVALTATEVEIDDNVVNGARNGIWVSQMKDNTFITGNTVGVQETGSGVEANGIIGQNIQQTSIGNNYVECTNTDWWRSGIEPNLGNFNSIWCNTTLNIGRGLFLSGQIQPVWLMSNEMNTNHTGMFFNWGPLQDIGTADYAYDNTWVNDFDYAHTDNIFDINLSTFNIFHRDNETDPPFVPTNNYPLHNAFAMIPIEANDFISNWEDYDCPTTNGSMLEPSGGDERDAAINVLEDDTEMDYYEEEGRWMARSGLYIKTLSDATLKNSDSDITDFHDSCATANIGKLMRANNALAGWYFVSEMGWYPTMDEEAAEEYLDTLDAMTISIVPEDALRDVLKIGLEKYLDETTVVDSMSYKVTAVLQELFPDSTFDVVEIKNPFYSSGQLSILETIAEECPYEYGPAVFMARAMLSKNDTVPYPYYHACEASPEPAALKWDGQNEPGITDNTIEEELNIKVYPNPSENELFVDVRGDDIERARFELWTSTGQKVKIVSLQAGTNKLILTELPSGIYNYIVYVEDVRKQSGKHVIIKR